MESDKQINGHTVIYNRLLDKGYTHQATVIVDGKTHMAIYNEKDAKSVEKSLERLTSGKYDKQ
jgi:hypothetical protein